MIDGEFQQKQLWPYQGARGVDALRPTKIRNDYHPNTNQNCNHLVNVLALMLHSPFLSDMATLNTDAANSSKPFVPTYQFTRRDILEHPNLHRRHCEN